MDFKKAQRAEYELQDPLLNGRSAPGKRPAFPKLHTEDSYREAVPRQSLRTLADATREGQRQRSRSAESTMGGTREASKFALQERCQPVEGRSERYQPHEKSQKLSGAGPNHEPLPVHPAHGQVQSSGETALSKAADQNKIPASAGNISCPAHGLGDSSYAAPEPEVLRHPEIPETDSTRSMLRVDLRSPKSRSTPPRIETARRSTSGPRSPLQRSPAVRRHGTDRPRPRAHASALPQRTVSSRTASNTVSPVHTDEEPDVPPTGGVSPIDSPMSTRLGEPRWAEISEALDAGHRIRVRRRSKVRTRPRPESTADSNRAGPASQGATSRRPRRTNTNGSRERSQSSGSDLMAMYGSYSDPRAIVPRRYSARNAADRGFSAERRKGQVVQRVPVGSKQLPPMTSTDAPACAPNGPKKKLRRFYAEASYNSDHQRPRRSMNVSQNTARPQTESSPPEPIPAMPFLSREASDASVNSPTSEVDMTEILRPDSLRSVGKQAAIIDPEGTKPQSLKGSIEYASEVEQKCKSPPRWAQLAINRRRGGRYDFTDLDGDESAGPSLRSSKASQGGNFTSSTPTEQQIREFKTSEDLYKSLKLIEQGSQQVAKLRQASFSHFSRIVEPRQFELFEQARREADMMCANLRKQLDDESNVNIKCQVRIRRHTESIYAQLEPYRFDR